MKGADLIDGLKKKLKVKTDKQLAGLLGNSVPALQNWKKRSKVTERQLVGLIASVRKSAAKALQQTAIRPLVEFFRIEKKQSSSGTKYEIFAVANDGEHNHPYLQGLRTELESHHGVYIFFDSSGQAIYTGKARRQHLWKEVNLAFNRSRGELQKIRRVKHPTRKQAYKTSDEKSRQITEQVVPLHELAAYVSAYQVVDGMIDEVEAMLVRSFANNLLNKRMERFGQQRKAKKRKTVSRKTKVSKRT